MADKPTRFRVIDGGNKPRAFRAKKRGDAELLVCATCEVDTGVATAETFEGKMGRMVRDGKPEGGTKAIYCLRCLTRGKLTRLI